jgi:signal transduction histidine kinase
MSQVETGNIQLKLQATDAKDIIEQAIQAVQFQAQQKKITLHKNIQESLPVLQADIEKTSWVLINFLTNAIKYSPESSVIEIAAYLKNEGVEFMVKDSGIGIDEKYLPKIFDRYFKVPGNHDRTGTGLGLSISKEFIQAQHGHIRASSKMNEGSEFYFLLPIA